MWNMYGFYKESIKVKDSPHSLHAGDIQIFDKEFLNMYSGCRERRGEVGR